MAQTALVIGGGIGGLAAGIALAKVGYKVHVFEKTHELKEVGAGIMLYPNAIAALRKLGAYDAVAAAGSFGRHGKYITANGNLLVQLDLKDVGLDKEAIAVHRADLQDALADRLGREHIHLGKALTNFSQNGSVVLATFADGSTAQGDLLVGADGLHSAVRRELLKDGGPQYSGCFAWRGVAHGDFPELPPETGFLAFGKGAQFGGMYIGKNSFYWFGCVADPRGKGERTTKQAALAAFAKWASPMPQLIEATADDELLTHDLYDRIPTNNWGHGAVTLLGDAAHPMVPFMGQGGCQALEDSIALGASMKSAASIESGLRAYEDLRRERTANYVLQSRKSKDYSMSTNPIVCGMRDFVLSVTPKKILFEQLHTLSNYDQPDL
jgi:2-polyprenyl-6-methoxyphenol hydroxylase-like FAD-dependent oxidoreductase